MKPGVSLISIFMAFHVISLQLSLLEQFFFSLVDKLLNIHHDTISSLFFSRLFTLFYILDTYKDVAARDRPRATGSTIQPVCQFEHDTR